MVVSRWFFCADSVLSIDCCCSEACVTGDQGVFAGRCAKHTKIRNIRSKEMWLVEASYRSLRTSGFLSLSFISFSFTVFFSHFSGKRVSNCIGLAIGIIMTIPMTSLRWLKQTKTFVHYMKGSIMAGQAQNPLTRNIWYTSEMH
jgi:hypothetical protein